MGPPLNIRGIPIQFPFEPYEIQKDYMSKVIECLQNEGNAILESPTGTGKTLCLLCASLAWLTAKKAQIQAQRCMPSQGFDTNSIGFASSNDKSNFLQNLQTELNEKGGSDSKNLLGYFTFPTIIYASRTHSQLYQAMQELKRTSYTHLKAIVIGSREHLCIHPDIVNEESNSLKINMCRLKLHSKTCHFYNRVDKLKDTTEINNEPVLDIEDLIKLGKQHRFCPYFMSKEMKRNADIIFMPYNYLLDPVMRKSLGIDLINNIVIMDEAHNIEKICEDTASVQLKSTDIALCLEEITAVMKAMTEEPISFDSETPKDFSAEELCAVKEMFLNLEKVVDALKVTKSSDGNGTSYDGDYMFNILNEAGINFENYYIISAVLEKITQFISTVQNGPLQRKGNSLDVFNSLLHIVFQNCSPQFKSELKRCFKLHITEEENIKTGGALGGWFSKTNVSKTNGKVLNYWCFSPKFGMNMLIEKGIRAIILTSGTLAPLKPLISELGLRVSVTLENPHIVKPDQICVRIVNKGPDGVELNSSYNNRNNPEYVSSLGRTILNLTRIIPDGLLIFFPSYPVLEKCRQLWEEEGLWANICNQKIIYVEPKRKPAFDKAMTDFYASIKDTNNKGAIFMGVCRGKVSEGLDFADANGRAVIIIGLPYPPFKDPRVVLKKQYLDSCHISDKEYLTGSDWYSLEAIRAVNQAIGRVIRHKDDYGAILLLDSRFCYSRIQSQVSMWLRKQVKLVDNFGEVIRSLREFYRNAGTNLPPPKEKLSVLPTRETYQKSGNFDFSSSSACSSLNSTGSVGLVTIHNRSKENSKPINNKRKRIVIVPSTSAETPEVSFATTTQEYIAMVKRSLSMDDYKAFLAALSRYRDSLDFNQLTDSLDAIFLDKYNLRYIIQGLSPYIKQPHIAKFNSYWERMR